MSQILGGGGTGLFTLAASVPVNQHSPGTPYQVAFDAQGNLYICYATNTWAKYTNTAPFGPQGRHDAQPLGMP